MSFVDDPGSDASRGTDSDCLDRLGRPLRDLRLSVTDRCNFRCRYCMPRERVESGSFLPRAQVLRFEEIVRVARIFVGLGVKKIRLTGGEPLLRRDLPRLVAQLSSLPVDLALTTNAVRLPELATQLRDAGLARLTVSLDALDEEVFQRMADAPAHSVASVLRGIEAAERAGFGPLKINCVVRRGVNESQVLPLLDYFAPRGHIVRFIEFMDVGTRNEWERSEVVSEQELREMIRTRGKLDPLPPTGPGEVARRYSYLPERVDLLEPSGAEPSVLEPSGAEPRGAGPLPAQEGAQARRAAEVGIITSVSRPFCGACSRARLSADGKVYTCLFGTQGYDLREPLRDGHSDQELRRRIVGLWSERADRYSEERAQPNTGAERRHLPVARAEMSYIGG